MAKLPKTGKNKALPYLAAAIICEKVLLEPDGVLTPVRIVDNVTLAADEAIEKGKILTLDLTLLLAFKSGDARGKRRLRLSLINPSGGQEDAASWQFNLTAPPDDGHNFRIALRLKWETEGLYWFAIFLEDAEITRIPLRVQITRSNGLRKKEDQ